MIKSRVNPVLVDLRASTETIIQTDERYVGQLADWWIYLIKSSEGEPGLRYSRFFISATEDDWADALKVLDRLATVHGYRGVEGFDNKEEI